MPCGRSAKEWRSLLFPDASNEQFADGYAQAATFGLLVARVRNIDLSKGLDEAANQLRTDCPFAALQRFRPVTELLAPCRRARQHARS